MITILNKKMYFLYASIVFISFIIISYITFKFNVWISNYPIGQTTALLHIIISPFFYILIGIIIGLENLLKENRKFGTWKIDKNRLIFLGLPTLYLTFYTYIYFFIKIISLPSELSTHLLDGGYNKAAGIVFGYFCITSFYKEHKNQEV